MMTMKAPRPPHIAIIGAGWAGLAAAVAATQKGWRTTVFEAARQSGGRARTVPFAAAAAHAKPLTLDNGQHILIGAYRQSLALMRTVGVDPTTALLRTSLDLRDWHGNGLRLPRLPAQLAGLAGVLAAKGWPIAGRFALLRQLRTWQNQGFTAPAEQSVLQLCHKLPEKIIHSFIEPLCVAALNTPVEKASAQVFLRVLQDSMLGGAGSADLLLPRLPLGSLLAEPATQWLQRNGSTVLLGQRVQSIRPSLSFPHTQWQIDDAKEVYDAVIVATAAHPAISLLEPLAEQCSAHHMAESSQSLATWLANARALEYEAIATVYLQTASHNGPLLPRPMVQMPASPGGAPAQPAQFAFDRQTLSQDTGVLALVASACKGDKLQLQAQTLAQTRAALGNATHLGTITPIGAVVEKRATFACTPGLQRPAQQPMTDYPTLLACGDYVDGPYPATLEGAVISGNQAISRLANTLT